MVISVAPTAKSGATNASTTDCPEAGAVVKKTAGQQKHAPPGAGRSEHGKETHAEDGGPGLREKEACGRKMIVVTVEDNRAF